MSACTQTHIKNANGSAMRQAEHYLIKYYIEQGCIQQNDQEIGLSLLILVSQTLEKISQTKNGAVVALR